jgi:hypothetical protein
VALREVNPTAPFSENPGAPMTHRLHVREHARSDRSAKRERGTGRVSPANEARAYLGGNKPMEATAAAYGAIPKRRWLAAVGEQSPGEAGPIAKPTCSQVIGTSAKGQKPQEGPGGSRGPHGAHRGAKPRRVNPRRGTGME